MTFISWWVDTSAAEVVASQLHARDDPLRRRNVQRILIALTLANLALLIFSLTRAGSVGAQAAAPVLRGRALEIVDSAGRVRASIKVLPANPSFKWPDGRVGYPETVLLRMITPEGRPNVKIGASETGASLGLGGQSDPTYVTLLAEGTSTSVKLVNKDGKQYFVKP